MVTNLFSFKVKNIITYIKCVKKQVNKQQHFGKPKVCTWKNCNNYTTQKNQCTHPIYFFIHANSFLSTLYYIPYAKLF